MNALRQLGFLKLNLRPERATPEHEHRVIELFRNRAELKKAYGGLEEETYRLKDLVKQQEAATQRAQDMLAELEARLSTNDTAYATLTFYQLRRLWQCGRELIQQFARRQAAESQVAAAHGLSEEAAALVANLESELLKLTRFWHYFKRKSVERRLHGAQAAAAAASAAFTDKQRELESVNLEELPGFPGLSLDARRAINLAAIAYAEVLCARLHVIQEPLLTMAREATGRRSAADVYGSPKECVLLMAQISRAQRLLESRVGLTEEIRAHTERLKPAVSYRGASDTCPTSDSLAAAAEAVPHVPNVLAEDTWDLFRVLLR